MKRIYAPVIEGRPLRDQVVRTVPTDDDDEDDVAYRTLKAELYGHPGKSCSLVHPNLSHDEFLDAREEAEEEKRRSAKLLGPVPEIRGPAMVSVSTIPVESLRSTIAMSETLRQITGGRVRLRESRGRPARSQQFLQNIATDESLTEMEKGRLAFMAAFHNTVQGLTPSAPNRMARRVQRAQAWSKWMIDQAGRR